MMFAALMTFFVYFSIIIMIGYYGVIKKRAALISFSVVMTVLTCLRQIIFFLHLDVPLPQSHFQETEFELMAIANLVLMAWMFFIIIGYTVFRKVAASLSPIFPGGPDLKPNDHLDGMMFPAVAATAFTAIGTAYLVLKFGGFAELLYASKIGKETAGLFIFMQAASLGAIISIAGFVASVRRTASGRILLNRASWVYLGLIFLAMVANYAWGNRYNIALTMIVFGLAWHYMVRPLRIHTVIIVAVVALSLLQFLKLLRLDMVADVRGWESEDTESFWLSLSTSLHFSEFDALMLALRDAGNLFDFRHGQDFINGLLSWVPRFLYPDKATYAVGSWFRQVYQPGVVNGWPVTVVGSWYVNFAAIGVVIGGLVSGFAMRVLDAAFWNLNGNPWHAGIGLGLAFTLFGGGINTGFPQMVFLLVIPLFLATRLLKRSKGRPSLRAQQGGAGQQELMRARK